MAFVLRKMLDREGMVKAHLVQTLVECVKELQLQFTSKRQSSLTNGETTNSLCYCIEAIFIHGLKSPFLKTMSSALKSTTTRENQIPQPSFWEFILVFCHQELISQITSLSNINTDIGRCRAWLRTVLNDGLFISYMQLILTDKRVLKDYYKTNAFLRDAERCDVLKSYLYGIESYNFQLASNSSLLNSWNSTPLSLVGLWTPFDAVVQGVDVAENMSATDLQALPNLRIQATSNPSLQLTYDNLTRPPLLEEDEALRVILSSKGSGSFQNSRSILRTENSSLEDNDGMRNKLKMELVGEVNNPGGSNLPSSSGDDRIQPNKGNGYSVKEIPEPITARTVSTINSQSCLLPVHSENAYDTSACTHVEDKPSPSPALTPHEEGSYAALFRSYHSQVSESAIDSSGGIELPPITVGSFLESNFFLPCENNETTTSALNPNTKADSDIYPRNHSKTSSISDPRDSIASEDEVSSDSPISSFSQGIVDMIDAPLYFFEIMKNIPNECGLQAQNYKCRECQREIGMIYRAVRVCGFTGNYYCTECHVNDEYVIPARILLNWDFSRFNVSRKAKAFLQEIVEKPLFNLKEINPSIYQVVEECSEILKLRTQLQSVSLYLKSCRSDPLHGELSDLWPEDHLYQELHVYSIADLLTIPSRLLHAKLNKLAKFGINHIYNCDLCKQKGFVCEMCRDSAVIFPFDLEKIFKCSVCGAVYHNVCMNNNVRCPRCQRWKFNVNQISG